MSIPTTPSRLWRRFVLLGTPLIIASLSTTHPTHYHPTGVFHALAHSVDWWITLHVVQLVLFGLLGLALYLLVRDLDGLAARICRISTAVFVVFYNAFDAVVGIGTGVQIKYGVSLPPDQQAPIVKAVDAYWVNGVVILVTAVAVASWIIAALAAAIARSEGGSRRLLTLLSVVIFPLALFSVPLNFYGTPAWWALTIGLSIAFGLVAKPHLPMGLLVLATILFATSHTPPFGAPGMICFFLAVVQLELLRRAPAPEGATTSAIANDLSVVRSIQHQ